MPPSSRRTSDRQASSLAGSATNVEYIHGAVCAIDPEEHPIHMSGAPIMEYAHRTLRVNTLRRDWTPSRVLIEGENGLLEAIEPRRALVWRSLDDPEIQVFDLGFGVLRQLNAVCHVCVEAG